MLTVRLPEELEGALNRMAKKSGHTKTDYVIKALERYFDVHGNKLKELARLMEKKPELSFEDAQKKVDFWGDKEGN